MKKCLGCSKVLPPAFLDLGNTPLANSYLEPNSDSLDEAVFPLAVVFCPECYLVQLSETVPPAKMFTDYLYFSSYSDSFLAHARTMCDSLTERFNLGRGSRVLEIASNDGYLLQYFKFKGIPVLGVEPASNIAEESRRRGIETLNCFFGPQAVGEILSSFGSVDLIIGNNVLAHVPAINEFLASATACLKKSGCAVFEFPHVQELLLKTEFDTIYHEHVFYYSLHALKHLADRAGLEIFDVSRQNVHGGTLRVFLRRASGMEVADSVKAMLDEEFAAGLTCSVTYAAFSDRVVALKRDLRRILKDLKSSGKKICAYGAPAKGNTLLNYCDIGTDVIEFTVDRSPHKQNKLLPGTRIPIRGPAEILVSKPEYLLILPWNIQDEIMRQMVHIRTWGGKFLIPIPCPKVI